MHKCKNTLSKKVICLLVLITSTVLSINSKSTSEWQPKTSKTFSEMNTVEELNISLDSLIHYTQILKQGENGVK